ncbi:MAG: MarR family transcriptional regulator [Dehalococcoidales bacterium]|nr:MarR family transcriptional regulator [Dehalococcoidales bacterium]
MRHTEVIDEILKLGDRLFRRLLPTVPREVIELDLSMTQLKIAFILFIKGPQRMSDLAGELGVTLATATGLVDRLVERGIIAREGSPDDRRVVLCRLSPEGEKTVRRIWESARENCRRLLGSLDAATLEAFASVLRTIVTTAETRPLPKAG